MEFMGKVMDAVVARRHDGKRTEDERPGIRSCVSLGQWIKLNKAQVKATIANDSGMFKMIMKQATQTLNTYIRTGVWNKVFWVTSHDDYSSESSSNKINLRVHFVWTPQNGQSMTKDEDNRLEKAMVRAAHHLRDAGYSAWLPEDEEKGRRPYDRIGLNASTEAGSFKRIGHSSGNVFELMKDFFDYSE